MALVVGCQQQTTPAPPRPGEWTTTTEFGELGFTVNPDSTRITKVSFDFAEFKCGNVQMSGGMSIESETLWPICYTEHGHCYLGIGHSEDIVMWVN